MEQALVGQHIEQFVHGADAAESLTRLERQLERGAFEMVDQDHEVVRRDQAMLRLRSKK